MNKNIITIDLDLISNFEKNLKILNLSKNTIKNYTFDILNFIKFIQENKKKKSISTEDLNIELIKNFIVKLKINLKNKSINRKIQTIKKFLKFISYNYEIEFKFIEKLKNIRTEKNLPKVISDQDIKKIIDYLINRQKPIWQNTRDALIIEMLYSTGLRISELCNLKFTDFLINEDFIHIKGKGNKTRSIPILSNLNEKIDNLKNLYPFQIKNEDFLFLKRSNSSISIRSIQSMLKIIRADLNLPSYLTPHKIRHSFATSLLENGLNIKQIQNLLGHSNLNTTQIYTKIDKKNLIKKLEKIKQ